MIAVGAALLAQQPARIAPPAAGAPKAPPRVDKALRSRVQFFFQAHVDGKLRLADQVVAPDSKEIFFAIQKSRYYSCEIAKIDYSDNFKRAKATVMCEEDIMMFGAGRVRLKIPRLSDWKIVRGKWYWYVDPNKPRPTPFGPATPVARTVTKTEAGNTPPTPFALPKGPTQAEVRRLVTADKMEVRLSGSEPSSAVVTITNGMPGWVTLSLTQPPLPGCEAKLDQKELKTGQQAHVTIRYTPQGTTPPPPTGLSVMVEPIGKRFLIGVRFETPAPAKDKQPQ